MKEAKTLGVIASPEPTNDDGNGEEKIFNFGVYKYGRDKTSLSRRILQVWLAKTSLQLLILYLSEVISMKLLPIIFIQLIQQTGNENIQTYQVEVVILI